MPYMYILKCVDDSYYTGSTWNMEKRLAEHQQGLGARHTAKRLPVELVYCEVFDRVEDAFRREKQVQGWNRKKKEALIIDDSNALHQLAECQNGTHWLRDVDPFPERSRREHDGGTAQADFGSLRLRSGSEPTDHPSSSKVGTARCLSAVEGNNAGEPSQ